MNRDISQSPVYKDTTLYKRTPKQKKVVPFIRRSLPSSRTEKCIEKKSSRIKHDKPRGQVAKRTSKRKKVNSDISQHEACPIARRANQIIMSERSKQKAPSNPDGYDSSRTGNIKKNRPKSNKIIPTGKENENIHKQEIHNKVDTQNNCMTESNEIQKRHSHSIKIKRGMISSGGGRCPIEEMKDNNSDASCGSRSITPKASNVAVIHNNSDTNWTDKIVLEKSFPVSPMRDDKDDDQINKQRVRRKEENTSTFISREMNLDKNRSSPEKDKILVTKGMIQRAKAGSVDNQEIVAVMLASKQQIYQTDLPEYDTRSNMEGKIVGGTQCESADESEVTMYPFTSEDAKKQIKRWRRAKERMKSLSRPAKITNHIVQHKYLKPISEENSLPEGWFIRFSKSKPNRFYYCHPVHGTTWTHPSEHPIVKQSKNQKKKQSSSFFPAIHQVFPNPDSMPEIADVSPMKKKPPPKLKIKMREKEKRYNKVEKCYERELSFEDSDLDQTSNLSDHEITGNFEAMNDFDSNWILEETKQAKKKKAKNPPRLCSLQQLFS